MIRQSSLFFLLCVFSIPSYSQWKALPPSYANHPFKNSVKVEVNQTENKTRITCSGSGKEEILDCCVQDYRIVDDFLCLKKVNVINEGKSKVVFRIYQTRSCRFLREVQLLRRTYDYTKVEFGEGFVPHSTYPMGKALFFVLHEDCEGTPSGKEVHIYYGGNLKQEKVVPLSAHTLAFWINDDLTEMTTVSTMKRIIKKSLTNGQIIWELNPDEFSCGWFNYAPRMILNKYLCIEGIGSQDSMFSYYIVDMDNGKVIDVLFSHQKKGNPTLINHCKNLSKGMSRK